VSRRKASALMTLALSFSSGRPPPVAGRDISIMAQNRAMGGTSTLNFRRLVFFPVNCSRSACNRVLGSCRK